jgi:hypothetical protein
MNSMLKITTLRYVLVLLALISFNAEFAHSAKKKVDPDKATPENPAPWAGKHLNGRKCANPQGPPGGVAKDYRDKNWAATLQMVEVHHFTSDVRKLIRGTSSSVANDLDFVLRAFPNHHVALESSIKYSLRYKNKPWPKDNMQGLPAECYLQRALAFRPDDPILYRLYGYYMDKRGRHKEALNANLIALEYWPKDVMLHYNTALL